MPNSEEGISREPAAQTQTRLPGDTLKALPWESQGIPFLTSKWAVSSLLRNTDHLTSYSHRLTLALDPLRIFPLGLPGKGLIVQVLATALLLRLCQHPSLSSPRHLISSSCLGRWPTTLLHRLRILAQSTWAHSCLLCKTTGGNIHFHIWYNVSLQSSMEPVTEQVLRKWK